LTSPFTHPAQNFPPSGKMALLMTSMQTWSLPQRGHLILVMNMASFEHKTSEEKRASRVRPQTAGDEANELLARTAVRRMEDVAKAPESSSVINLE
jgi:hypothetical protein